MAKLSSVKSLNLPRFCLKYLQYKARTCFNNRAISRSHYDLPGIKHGFQLIVQRLIKTENKNRTEMASDLQSKRFLS